MEEHLISLLTGAGHTAAWAQLPRDARPPYIALFRISGLDDITLDGRSGWIGGRVQADCYGETYAEAIGLARSVTATLSGYRGGPIWHAALESIRDRPDVSGGTVIQRVSLDFALTWRE